jgi:L-aspartate oxidase
MPQTDVLIIGSGIAGLCVAIKISERFPGRQCLIITKQESAESNTRYAQGGIAVVSDFVRDSFEEHISDTLKAGDGLCNRAVVEHVVHQAPARLKELIAMGADFDRKESGELLLGREGGHTANRIIHFQDITGLNISTALLEKVRSLRNVRLLSHHVAIDLIVDGERQPDAVCHGARVLNLETNEMEQYFSAVTVLATGGLGQLYSTTTNPLIATGDGIAMAHRAGAAVSNMEFIQFHPTALYDGNISPAFLISEAVRGQGAYLRNSRDERFMFRYHIDGELACRDVVSRAIGSELQTSGEKFVYLDCTHIEREIVLNHFPNIYQKCLATGIDISRDYIPVAPAAHYLCGGIDVDIRSRTSVQNLYACGECADTGLHGANRLASNSLLEATVFAHNCFKDIESLIEGLRVPASAGKSVVRHGQRPVNVAWVAEKRRGLQNLMTNYAGIVRTTAGLEHALSELNVLQHSMMADVDEYVFCPSWHELRNMLLCARLIIKQSLNRGENKGGFYNEDLATQAVVN